MEGDTAEACEIASRVLNKFRRELSAPELYLEPSQSLGSGCLSEVELLFRCLRQIPGHVPVGPLQQLYTADFDEDQVWEELQLTNEPALLSLSRVVRIMKPGMRLEPNELEEEEDESGEEKEEDESGEEKEGDESGEEEVQEEEEGEEGEVQVALNDQRKSVVDDCFFSMSAMEQYLEKEDQLSDPGSEGSVGMLAEELSDNNSIQPHYQDFFDPPALPGAREKHTDLSTYEREKEKMARQIQSIEEANVHPKSWQMSGEASSRDRPLNSLLEEVVDFEPMSVPAPVVSEETTQRIEDTIRQRILDQAWDDVERKVKPLEKPYDYQRARPLNQERSKKSLAEVYEEEYVQSTKESQPSDGPEDERHVELEKLKNTLFTKLDALSNFHFTPKPHHSEPHVVSNVPAVVMEEVLPSATAQHTLLAPEEVQAKSRIPERGVTERTFADKRRQRMAKKSLKRKRGVKQLKKQAKDKSFAKTSSRHFFSSLQHKTSTLHNISH